MGGSISWSTIFFSADTEGQTAQTFIVGCLSASAVRQPENDMPEVTHPPKYIAAQQSLARAWTIDCSIVC